MKLSYGTLISPFPIVLSVGTLRKPKLKDIANPPMSFEKFYYYEFLISMTPEDFFTQAEEDGKKFWESLSQEEKDSLTVFYLITENNVLMNNFLEVFNFFFEETVLYVDGAFVLVNPNKDYRETPPTKEDVVGFINSKNFSEILYIIQQICCIAPEEPEKPKFKNKAAERIYNKIHRAEQENKKKKKVDINMTLPNLISKVSSKHSSLNYSNIWDITVFELLDSFGSMQNNVVFDIECTRVSVWGDEKKTFDIAKWYKNNFDNSKS